MEFRRANPESVLARRRPVFPPGRSAAVDPEARLHPARRECFVNTLRCSTAAKSPAQASARNNPRCAPRSGRRSAAVMGATTATTAWRTPMASQFGTAACARTRRRRPQGRLVPAAESQAPASAPLASSANSPRPHNVARRTSQGSANRAPRPAQLTTTLSAAATGTRTQTHAPLKPPAYRSRVRAAVRPHDRAAPRRRCSRYCPD